MPTAWFRGRGYSAAFIAPLLIALSLLPLTGCYPKQEVQTEQPPAMVRTAKAEKKDVQLNLDFSGITDADPIKIVPRVRGYIEKINFFPGDVVDAGDVLYQIEDFDYKNNVESAKASLDIAVAQAAKNKADHDRELSLQAQGPGYTTQADLDRTKALWDETVGKVAAAEAELSEAQKQLERCTIKAPVKGKINRTQIEKGNLVDGTGASPPELTTLIPMDPMYVYFQITDSVFETMLHNIMDALKEKLGDRFQEGTPYDNETITAIARKEGIEQVIRFEMGFIDDKNGKKAVYPYSGVINYNDNRVDTATGTVTVRGEFKNPNYMVYPGLICNIRVPGQKISGAVLIQEKAICYDLSDVYIWKLDDKGLPVKQMITLGPQLDLSTRIVTEGLNGDETYIVDGTQNVREGGKIAEAKDEPAADAKAPESTESAPTAEEAAEAKEDVPDDEPVKAKPAEETAPAEQTEPAAVLQPAESAKPADQPAPAATAEPAEESKPAEPAK